MFKITPPMNRREKAYVLVFCIHLVLICFVISWSISSAESRAADKAQKSWRHR